MHGIHVPSSPPSFVIPTPTPILLWLNYWQADKNATDDGQPATYYYRTMEMTWQWLSHPINTSCDLKNRLFSQLSRHERKYHSKLGGLYGIIYVVEDICTTHLIKNRHITISCNGKEGNMLLLSSLLLCLFFLLSLSVILLEEKSEDGGSVDLLLYMVTVVTGEHCSPRRAERALSQEYHMSVGTVLHNRSTKPDSSNNLENKMKDDVVGGSLASTRQHQSHLTS
eukprot:scaffold96066_cov45-Attheya_sp.AAC.1